MPRMTKELRLFLASPSDVSNEREIVNKVVAQLNRTIASELGCMIRLIRWEDMVPGIQQRAQDVILDQVDIESTDIFLGVLWNRFGTPTGQANSGTEEEFNIAYQSWVQHRRPRILLYFGHVRNGVRLPS